MDPHAGKIVLNGAPSQFDRKLEARGLAEVDGRSFSELLDFAVQYGGLINFYDLANEIDGDWVPFFLTDPTMVLAAMEATEAEAREKAFEAQLPESLDMLVNALQAGYSLQAAMDFVGRETPAHPEPTTQQSTPLVGHLGEIRRGDA